MNDAPTPEVVVFTEAIQLPMELRAAFLDKACAGDEDLRRRVESLLKINDRVGTFLEDTPTGEMSERRRSAAESTGDRIGRYKLLQQIGEGGCGIVFMAEQEEPVRRRVALKIIKPGMDTKSVIARFEAERQALALMDHPNIAKVFDAGATDSGRPYFVMELIRGVSITEYCDQNALTTEERLKLFMQVCEAIQHAHQKGVIHRDIKPSNILVTTTQECAALPVVIDFGIAKATTNQRLTDKTLFTAFEMLIGTPAYMSPEQAALTGVDVDTRTDIYSLGVLLYELLTGSTPFDTGELLKAGLDEIRRVIREEEPVRPSTRLSKMTGADLTTLAQHRKAEPSTLIHSTRGDLDWIVMKALEKDRTRRYPTAYSLVVEVQRYLAHEPISARPPSRLYKFQKTVLRNKLLFAGVGVIALLVVGSLIVVSASLATERRSRREAEAAKGKAEAASIKSRQVTTFLEEMLEGVGPSVALGRDTQILREMLDRTAERVGLEMTNQPAVEVELLSLIGQVYQELAEYPKADAIHQTALSLNRKLYGPQSKEAAKSLEGLGLALWRENKLVDAEAVHRESLTIRRRLFGNEDRDVATSLVNLANVYRHQQKPTDAEPLVREALAINTLLFGRESRQAAASLRVLAILFGDQGKPAEAEEAAREVLRIRRKLLNPEDPLIAASLADVAWAAGKQGKWAEVEPLQREALTMQRKLLGEFHPKYLESLSGLVKTLESVRKWSEAETLRREALDLWRKRVGNEDRRTLQALCDLAMTLEAQRKWSDAETIYREALAAWRKRAGDEDPQTLYTLAKLGSALEAEGKLAESEQAYREVIAVWIKKGKSETPLPRSEWESLIRVLVARKKIVDAEKLLDEALTPAIVKQAANANLLFLRIDVKVRRGQWQEAVSDATLAFEHAPSNQWRFPILAALLVKTQNRPAYEKFCKNLLATFASTTDLYVADQVAKSCLFLPSAELDLKVIGHLTDETVTRGIGARGSLPYFQDCKALSEYRQGHYAEAVEWAQKPLKIPGIHAHGHAYAVLAMSYWRLGQKDEARAMLAKGETLAPRIMPMSIAEDPSNAWQGWLFARIQLDEAKALFESAESGSKP